MLDTHVIESESTPSTQQASGSFTDGEAHLHTIVLISTALLVDGQPARIVGVNAQSITLRLEQATITCASEAFWHALFGEAEPTAADAGMLLAQNVARWIAALEQEGNIRHLLEHALNHLERDAGLDALCLPAKRLDPFTERVLESFDGTRESAGAISRVLGQPHTRILELLEQAGKSMQALREGSKRPGEEETRAKKGSPASNGHRPGTRRARTTQRFDWTPEHVQTLREQFEAIAPGQTSMHAIIVAIADATTWPWKSVEYKLEAIGLTRAWQEAHKGAASTDQAQVPTAQEEQEAPSPAAALPTTVPDPDLSAEAQEQEAPRAEEAQHLASTPAPGALAPVLLEAGSRQWQIQGLQTKGRETPRWPLAYAFGEFPVPAGSQITFRGQTYLLEQVGNSVLQVCTT
jgi:hypothetical protein